MDHIEQRPTPKAESCKFNADVSTTSNPQDSVNVCVHVRYTSTITQMSNEGLSFWGYSGLNDEGEKVIACAFRDYLSEVGLTVKCKDNVDNVTLIELALDYIGAGNLKYVVSERYIEVV